MLFELPFDAKSSFSSFLVAFSWSFWLSYHHVEPCLSDCCCWPVQAMCVTTLHVVVLRTCSSWSPVNNSDYINSIDTTYIFLTVCECLLLKPSLPKKNSITTCCLKYITIPHHFDDPLHIYKKTYCSAALQKQVKHSELTTEKIACLSFCFWQVAKHFGQP